MSAGVVDFSRIMGTAFSGAVSGPAWHPTHARCSPRRIQKNPDSRFRGFAGAVEQFDLQWLVARNLHKERPIALDRCCSQKMWSSGSIAGIQAHGMN